MKHNLSLALLSLSFFFAFKHPLEKPGLSAVTIINGFETKAECEEYLDSTKELLAAYSVKAEFSDCKELRKT